MRDHVCSPLGEDNLHGIVERGDGIDEVGCAAEGKWYDFSLDELAIRQIGSGVCGGCSGRVVHGLPLP